MLLLNSIEPLIPILTSPRPGVFSDIDGTLAPIVDVPEDARINAGCLQALTELIERRVTVGLITGRDDGTAKVIADVPGALYATSHGLVINVDGTPEAPRGLKVYAALARSVLGRLNIREDWLIVENKGAVLAFHYRLAPDPGVARARILRELRTIPEAAQFRVQEGRMVVELFPDMKTNKGTALLELVERFDVSGVLCVGDDTTDIEMFAAARALGSGGVPAVSVAVTSPEATEAVIGAADYLIEGVPGVEWLLGEAVKFLRQTSPSAP